MTVMDQIEGSDSASPRAKIAATPDDRAMLRAAAELPRDLLVAKGRYYWPDFLAAAFVGYGALAVTILTPRPAGRARQCRARRLRALSRRRLHHELTHIRGGALPGFRFVWNLVVGIPLLIPSFMYEEVHTHHHAKTRYGTSEDPEYLPLASMKPWSLPLFILAALLRRLRCCSASP